MRRIKSVGIAILLLFVIGVGTIIAQEDDDLQGLSQQAAAARKQTVSFSYDCSAHKITVPSSQEWVQVCRNLKNCGKDRVRWEVPQGLQVGSTKYTLEISGKSQDHRQCFPVQTLSHPQKQKSSKKPYSNCVGLEWSYEVRIFETGNPGNVCATLDPGVIIKY